MEQTIIRCDVCGETKVIKQGFANVPDIISIDREGTWQGVKVLAQKRALLKKEESFEHICQNCLQVIGCAMVDKIEEIKNKKGPAERS